MKMHRIKKEIGRESITGEPDQEIRYVSNRGNMWQLFDEQKRECVKVKHSMDHVVATGMINGEGKMFFAKEHSFFQPARVCSMHFLKGKEKYTIVQSPKRDYTIYQNDRIIGTIYGIDSLKPEIQIEETIDENMVGLVYILAKIMYHQDDVFMV